MTKVIYLKQKAFSFVTKYKTFTHKKIKYEKAILFEPCCFICNWLL